MLLHIKIDPGDITTAMGRRFGFALFKIDFHGTLPILRTVLASGFFPLAETIIGAVTIDLADSRYQVVKIRFHALELGIIFCAVFTSALLPALALVPQFPGGDDMFPLDTVGPFDLFTHLVTTAVELGYQLFALAADLTTTVKTDMMILVAFLGHFFGGAK